MSKILKYKRIKHKKNYKILNDLVPRYHRYGNEMFSGGFDCGSFESCDVLYNEVKLYDPTIIRLANEAPLTIHKICPQFFNSIIIREPLTHRLSLLAWENTFALNAASIWRYVNGQPKLCTDVRDMNGLINDLFDINNLNENMNKLRINTRQKIKVTLPFKRATIMDFEWINPNTKRFMIGVSAEFLQTRKQSNISYVYNYKQCYPFYRFNATYLMGWLSNTYARWIGYDHINEKTLHDSMNINLDNLDNLQYLLTNTKRLLMQYDYVLPLDGSQFKVNSDIWMYYAKEIQEKIFNVNLNDIDQVNFDWNVNNYDHKKNRKGYTYITTQKLLRFFNGTKEFNLLKKLNEIDLQIWHLAQKIANVDVLFDKFKHVLLNL